MAFLRRREIAIAALVLAALALPATAAWSQRSETQSEYAVKSVFLYNFCRFIEWPRDAFTAPNAPIVIGIIGEDPFASLLSDAIQGEAVRGRPIRMEHYRRPAEIGRCHLLFVSGSDAGNVDDILGAVAGRNIVTVGETGAFLDRGGMIALTTDEKRVRLRINAAHLRAANVNVSSKLLRVAEIKS